MRRHFVMQSNIARSKQQRTFCIFTKVARKYKTTENDALVWDVLTNWDHTVLPACIIHKWNERWYQLQQFYAVAAAVAPPDGTCVLSFTNDFVFTLNRLTRRRESVIREYRFITIALLTL